MKPPVWSKMADQDKKKMADQDTKM